VNYNFRKKSFIFLWVALIVLQNSLLLLHHLHIFHHSHNSCCFRFNISNDQTFCSISGEKRDNEKHGHNPAQCPVCLQIFMLQENFIKSNSFIFVCYPLSFYLPEFLNSETLTSINVSNHSSRAPPLPNSLLV